MKSHKLILTLALTLGAAEPDDDADKLARTRGADVADARKSTALSSQPA